MGGAGGVLLHLGHCRISGRRISADTIGRRPLLVLYFCGSIAATPLVYLGRIAATIALTATNWRSLQAWAVVWMAIILRNVRRPCVVQRGMIFNLSRFVAGLGPLSGSLISRLGGYSYGVI